MYESMGLNCHFNRNFMGNLLIYFISSKSLQLIATSNNYNGIFHQKFDLFKSLLLCSHQPPHGLDCWAEYVNKLLKDGFFDCKNSFYVKTFVLLKQWKIRLMNTKRIPQDSAWNFDSDIIWVGLINAYHKASNAYQV